MLFAIVLVVPSSFRIHVFLSLVFAFFFCKCAFYPQMKRSLDVLKFMLNYKDVFFYADCVMSFINLSGFLTCTIEKKIFEYKGMLINKSKYRQLLKILIFDIFAFKRGTWMKLAFLKVVIRFIWGLMLCVKLPSPTCFYNLMFLLDDIMVSLMY